MTDRNEHGFPVHPEIERMATEDAGGFVYGGLTWQAQIVIGLSIVAVVCAIGWAIRWALTAAGVVG